MKKISTLFIGLIFTISAFASPAKNYNNNIYNNINHNQISRLKKLADDFYFYGFLTSCGQVVSVKTNYPLSENQQALLEYGFDSALCD